MSSLVRARMARISVSVPSIFLSTSFSVSSGVGSPFCSNSDRGRLTRLTCCRDLRNFYSEVLKVKRPFESFATLNAKRVSEPLSLPLLPQSTHLEGASDFGELGYLNCSSCAIAQLVGKSLFGGALDSFPQTCSTSKSP